MRLVTFQTVDGRDRSGAFVDDDTVVVDLCAAAESTGSVSPALASVLAIVEAGMNGLDAASTAISRAPQSAKVPRQQVRLRAPIRRLRCEIVAASNSICGRFFLRRGSIARVR